MNETPSARNPAAAAGKPAAQPASTARDTDRRVRRAAFAILLLAVLAAGGYLYWQNSQQARQRLSADAESTRRQLDTLAQRTAQLERQINTALPNDIRTLQTRQQSLEDSIAQLRSKAAGGARVWDLEEIATLLQIANDRLRLEKEISPSLAALEAADRHLRDLKNPGLLEVRRLLAEEITALRSTADPDISGMALTLGALIQGIDRLPVAKASFSEPSEPGAESERGWRGLARGLWEKIKGLVIIQRHGGAERPLLAPDERYFLRQNLRLELEAARIALLRRDGPIYQQTLRAAAEWLALYFDEDATATAGATQELASLQRIDIAPTLPDISGSLNALQAMLERQRPQKAPDAPRTAQ